MVRCLALFSVSSAEAVRPQFSWGGSSWLCCQLPILGAAAPLGSPRSHPSLESHSHLCPGGPSSCGGLAVRGPDCPQHLPCPFRVRVCLCRWAAPRMWAWPGRTPGRGRHSPCCLICPVSKPLSCVLSPQLWGSPGSGHPSRWAPEHEGPGGGGGRPVVGK